MDDRAHLAAAAEELEGFLSQRRAALSGAWSDERARAMGSQHLDPLGEALAGITATAGTLDEAHRLAETRHVAASEALSRASGALAEATDELRRAAEWLVRCRGAVDAALAAAHACDLLVEEAEQELGRAGAGCGMALGTAISGMRRIATGHAGQRRALRQVGGSVLATGATEVAWTLGPEVAQRLTGSDLPSGVEDDLLAQVREHGLVMGAEISGWVKGVLRRPR